MKSRENKPSKLWPIGTPVTYLDAYGQNPVNGKVKAHYPIETNILVEDGKGVVHFGQTWRIDSDPPAARKAVAVDMFDDLLGDEEPAPVKTETIEYGFEDLL